MNDLAVKALSGKILLAKHVRKIIEIKFCKPVSDDYIWDLFKRHNWKKKKPRPEHPKKNKAVQEELKKAPSTTSSPAILMVFSRMKLLLKE
jgi:transposase